jgi:hypothetical protein
MLIHQSANTSRLPRKKFARQKPVPVEKIVDYLPQYPKQIPISALASSGHLLISNVSPYLSTWISSPATGLERLLGAAQKGPLFSAFHNRS